MIKRPLLAATCDDSNIHKLNYPLLASPKLDGIRVLIKDGVAYTRSMKPVRNVYVQRALGQECFNGLDGEVVAGHELDPLCFRNTATAVMAEHSKVEWTYWVFDDFTAEGNFAQRLAKLQDFCLALGVEIPIKFIPHRVINNSEELEVYEAENLHSGFEGTMLRDPNGRYKENRSTFNEGILLKLKRGQIMRADAVIVGFIERQQNDNEATTDERGLTKRSTAKSGKTGRGDLGSLLVKDCDTGTEFKVGNGPGLDDALRAKIWQNQNDYLGATIRYQWCKYGAYSKPRFPQYIAIRPADDLSQG